MTGQLLLPSLTAAPRTKQQGDVESGS